MTDVLDSYIKSPAPPKDPDAQYVYNEQQFGKLENALRKHHDKILDVQDNATALYETEVTARSTADSAIVQSVETLRATVEGNNTTTQGQIQNIQTAQAEADSSTASKLTALEAKVDSVDSVNRALITDEAKTRSTSVGSLASKVSSLEASFKVGQAENRALVKQETVARADAVSAEAIKRESLSAYVGYTDGMSYSSTLAASVSDEAVARAAADGAIAQKVSLLNAGSSQVYAQTYMPSGGVQGDIWYDTDDNFRQYVYHSSAWRDNSSGSYSQYAGQNASLTQISKVVYDPAGGSSYDWTVKGALGTNSLGQAAIRLTGARKPNSSGGYDTTSKFIIDADTEINGNLVVSGYIKGSRIATSATGATDLITAGNIGLNQIGRTGAQSASGDAATSVYCEAGGSILIIANFLGYYSSANNTGTGTLYIIVQTPSGSISYPATSSITSAPDGSGVSTILYAGAYSGGPTYAAFGTWSPQTHPILLPTAAVCSYAVSVSGTYNIGAQPRLTGSGTPIGTSSILAISLSR